MLIRRKRLFWFAVVLCVVGLTLLILPSSRAYCESSEANDYYCSPYEIAIAFGDFVEAHNGAITALATIIIGVFTYTLKRSTDKLWDAGERQLSHLERTAESELRAYVMIETVDVEHVSVGLCPEVRLVIKNSGQTSAIELTHWAAMGFSTFPLTGSLPLRKAALPPRPLAPGGTAILRTGINQVLNSATIEAIKSGSHALY